MAAANCYLDGQKQAHEPSLVLVTSLMAAHARRAGWRWWAGGAAVGATRQASIGVSKLFWSTLLPLRRLVTAAGCMLYYEMGKQPQPMQTKIGLLPCTLWSSLSSNMQRFPNGQMTRDKTGTRSGGQHGQNMYMC